MSRSNSREERFRVAYAAAYNDVLRFVQRRTLLHQADDVVAEAFLVAWRRVADLPDDPGDARAWLFGIARNCLFNQWRSAQRQDAVAVRVAENVTETGGTTPDDADLIARRVDLATAWRELRPADQEVLALTVFDSLTSAQAGAVLDISPVAYRLRLSRARNTLRRHLEGAASNADATYQEITL